MKEKLITFETAKLAKEKGFDIPTAWHYHPRYGLHTAFWDEDSNDNSNHNSNEWADGYYSAPTQSLLQKWLREKRNIFLTIRCDCDGKFDYHGYDVKFGETCFVKPEYQVDENECFEIGSFPYRFNTYEAALEAGLLETLKLT